MSVRAAVKGAERVQARCSRPGRVSWRGCKRGQNKIRRREKA